MSDAGIPATTPSPAPDSPKHKRIRGTVNRDYLDELKNARAVAQAALDPAYAPALAAEEFDPILATRALKLADTVDGALGKLVADRAGKKAITVQETTARDHVLGALLPIQTAARRKYSGDTAKLREAYGIGSKLSSGSLEAVSVFARGVLTRLSPGAGGTPPADTLPGVTATGRIKDLADALVLYGAANTEQGGKETGLEGSHETVAAQVRQLADLRHQIQLAADQAWNWRLPGVATIRRTFLLPADRPLPT